ncbi:MAG: hypothetical protein ACREVY_11725 [Gammaproteobacteria bacterium]
MWRSLNRRDLFAGEPHRHQAAAGADNHAMPRADTTLLASRLNQDNDVWSGELRLNGSLG